MGSKTKFTKQQLAFVDAYLSDPEMSGTNAAIEAGYSKRTAASQASQLLARAEIQALIEKKQAERIERTKIDQDYVLLNLVEAIEMAKGNKATVSTKTENGKQVVTKHRKTNLTALNKSLELAGRHLGMFVDKKEIEAKHTLAETMADVSKRNAAARKTLLPKDNIDFDEDDEYSND